MVLRSSSRSASDPSISDAVNRVREDIVHELDVVRNDSSSEVVRDSFQDLEDVVDVYILDYYLKGAKQLCSDEFEMALHLMNRNCNGSWQIGAINFWNVVWALNRPSTEE